MSKYNPLWEYISKIDKFPCTLTFDEIANIIGFTIDHSFLSYKKESLAYNFCVKNITLKNKKVIFDKL